MEPYWALVSADQARYRRKSEGLRLRAPRSFRAGGGGGLVSLMRGYGRGGLELVGDEERGVCLDEGKNDGIISKYITVLTDNIAQVIPAVGDEFLVGHRQQLVVQWCQVERRRLGHGSGMTVI